MDWFYVKNITGKEEQRTLINVNSIMSIRYSDETDLTIIDFIRSAYPSLYVRGDIVPDIKRLLSSHGDYVSQIGG